MMQPPSASSEPVVVQLTPPAIQIAAGASPVEITANIRNAGATVDQYSIELENLDPTWYTITEQSVALFPGDSAPILIRIHPPKSSNTRAGNYKFIVRARSHADPSLVGTTKGEIQVGGYTNFQVELAPKKFTGRKGKYRLNISNGGNSDAQLELTGRDPESNLKYGFRPSNPTVNAGGRQVVPVTVKPPGIKLVGQQTSHRFSILTRPIDGDEKDAKEVQGELIHRPVFRSWRWPIILGALFALFLCFILVRPQINPCSREFFMFPAPNGISSARFYYGILCDNYDLSLGGPKRQALSEQECGTAAGFAEIRKEHNELVGSCTESEFYDSLGNSHQKTQKGQLLYIPKGGTSNIYFVSDDGTMYTFVPDAGTQGFEKTKPVKIESVKSK
jgi:hypothetical protein